MAYSRNWNFSARLVLPFALVILRNECRCSLPRLSRSVSVCRPVPNKKKSPLLRRGEWSSLSERNQEWLRIRSGSSELKLSRIKNQSKWFCIILNYTEWLDQSIITFRLILEIHRRWKIQRHPNYNSISFQRLSAKVHSGLRLRQLCQTFKDSLKRPNFPIFS